MRSSSRKFAKCLICKKEAFRSPQMKLLVAVCGHHYCETCIERTFREQASFACKAPIGCRRQLVRKSFTRVTWEDKPMMKEISIRKNILKEFNKRREDFESLREYNDYLEEVEDIIHNLINGTDLEDTNARVRRNRRENQHLIAENQARKAEKDRALAAQLAEMEEKQLEKRMQVIAMEQKESRQLKAAREKLLAGLEEGRVSVDELRMAPKRLSSTSSGGVENNKKKKTDEEEEEEESSGVGAHAALPSAQKRSRVISPHKPSVEPLSAAFTYVPSVGGGGGGPSQPAPIKTSQPARTHTQGNPAHQYTPEEIAMAGGFTRDRWAERAVAEAFGGLFLFCSDE